MRLTIYSAVVLLAVGTTLSAAQDTTVKSRTKIEGDEAQVVSMTGCLRQDAQTRAFMLVGAVDAVGEKVGMRREQHGVGDSWHAELGWLDGYTYALLEDEWRADRARLRD